MPAKSRVIQRTDAALVSGSLRQFFGQVFGVMTIGLFITGVVAVYIANDVNMMKSLFNVYTYVEGGETKTTFTASGFWWLAAGIELLLVLAISWMGFGSSIGFGAAATLFGVYAGLNGITIAPVIYAYTGASVVKVFFITASMFGVAALWGHTTKRDITPMGSFFIMGLWGLLAMLVVNIFLHSPAYDYTVSTIAVLLFAGLTAWDMQMLEKIYHEEDGRYTGGTVVYGALALYLDFLNMFLHLLRLFGIKAKD